MPPKKSKPEKELRTFSFEVWGETMWTSNRERSLHHFQRAKLVKEWRGASATAATARKIPKKLKAVEIRFTPHRRNRQGRAVAGSGFVRWLCLFGHPVKRHRSGRRFGLGELYALARNPNVVRARYRRLPWDFVGQSAGRSEGRIHRRDPGFDPDFPVGRLADG